MYFRAAPALLIAAVAALACYSEEKTTGPAQDYGLQLQTAAGFTIGQDTSKTLDASVVDKNGNVVSNAGVSYRSLDPQIASVSGSGSVRGLRGGTARIETSYFDVNTGRQLAETTTITVRAHPIASIQVSLPQETNASGQVISPANTIYQSESRQVGVIAVSAAGDTIYCNRVSRQVNGQSQITCAETVVRNGKTVARIVRPVSFALATAGDTARASVSSNGTVTLRDTTTGTVRIRIRFAGDTGTVNGVPGVGIAFFDITAGGARPVSSIDVSPNPAAVAVGETVTLEATPRGTNGAALDRAVTCTSLNPAVATVDPATCKVTGVAPGVAIIHITVPETPGSAVLIAQDVQVLVGG